MSMRSVTQDLFGKPVRQRRPRYEAALEVQDKKTRADRAARVRWLSDTIPKNVALSASVETALVFEEATTSFVYGNCVAAIVLAAAFVEHWFVASLIAHGYQKEASQGLGAAIECARANNLVSPVILDKANHLRLVRNPFVHLKSLDHEHGIGQRIAKTQKFDIRALLESDAKEAIIAMHGVTIYAFGRRSHRS